MSEWIFAGALIVNIAVITVQFVTLMAQRREIIRLQDELNRVRVLTS